jgi:hypothetical protein
MHKFVVVFLQVLTVLMNVLELAPEFVLSLQRMHFDLLKLTVGLLEP